MPASGSTQRKVPLRPKWPNVRGEFREPVQCGALAVAQLEAEPPVVRLLAAEPRQHARRGRGTAPSSPPPASRAPAATEPAARAPARAPSPSVPTIPDPAGPSSTIPVPCHTCRDVVGERQTGALDDQVRRDIERVVRVDAPLARLRDRRAVLERQARRVREQVPEASTRAGPQPRRGRPGPPRRRRASPPTWRASSPTPSRKGARRRRALASTRPVTPTATCSHPHDSTCRKASTTPTLPG